LIIAQDELLVDVKRTGGLKEFRRTSESVLKPLLDDFKDVGTKPQTLVKKPKTKAKSAKGAIIGVSTPKTSFSGLSLTVPPIVETESFQRGTAIVTPKIISGTRTVP